MNPFVDKMIRAARLDITLYEEVERDKTVTFESMMVVVLASIASGIGLMGKGGFAGLITGTLVALITWLIWDYLCFFIGTKFLPEQDTSADYGELLRTLVLPVLGYCKDTRNHTRLGQIISFLAGIWMLVAMVIAVRQALITRAPHARLVFVL
jgi:sorbitol-specific phosphotransferase system component IIC